jgi:threonine dehydrogenase-like Zn-dependent dehydrogenase
VRVPFADHTLVALPPSVSALDAVSVGDNLTDAWRTVAPFLAMRPGVDVLILGSGSIGLYAADIAAASGARNVLYADADPTRCELAERLGARACAPAELDRRHANLRSRSTPPPTPAAAPCAPACWPPSPTACA